MTTEQLPFFVYGTLLPGQPNDYLWQPALLSLEKAVYEDGCLYDMSFYPMLIEKTDSQTKGMLITVTDDQYDAVLAAFDQLEGYNPAHPDAPGYRRVMRHVRRSKNGNLVPAWIYVGEPVALVAGCAAVPDGDWLAHSAGKRKDILNWWTDIDSVFGVYD